MKLITEHRHKIFNDLLQCSSLESDELEEVLNDLCDAWCVESGDGIWPFENFEAGFNLALKLSKIQVPGEQPLNVFMVQNTDNPTEVVWYFIAQGIDPDDVVQQVMKYFHDNDPAPRTDMPAGMRGEED